MEKFDATAVKEAAGLSAFEKWLPDLKKVNGEHRARCPFHDDSHPSLSVKSKDGVWVWYCHPCATGGDIFDFVKRKENIGFPQALAVLAAEFHVQPLDTSWAFDQQRAVADLQHHPDAQRYLRSRGISDEIAEQAGIGAVEYPGVGLMVSLPYSGDGRVTKFRAVGAVEAGKKFRHVPGYKTADLLFGIDDTDPFDPNIIVCESELDSLTLRSHGFNAVSVTSATSCVGKDGKLQIRVDLLERLEKAERIVLAVDQDTAGHKCAAAFEAVLPDYKTFRMRWHYEKDVSGSKDVGDLYSAEPASFAQRFQALIDNTTNRPPKWRTLFKTVDQMDSRPMEYLIEGIAPEGVTFIGALPGSMKTWFAMSMSKALVTGQKFLGHFNVPQKRTVLYLIPEAGERSFRKRCDTMRLSSPNFFVRTMTDGPLSLADPGLIEAVRVLKPVVFLDTFARFNQAESENDSSQNANGIAAMIFELRRAGAVGVVAIHHSPKSAGKDDRMTLENTLRGSGDIGAIADAVQSLKVLDAATLEVQVECVKARDFEAVPPFTIQARPYLDRTGDFNMHTPPGRTPEFVERELVAAYIETHPSATVEQIGRQAKMNKNRVTAVARQAGWEKGRGKSEAWRKIPRDLSADELFDVYDGGDDPVQ